jgi:aminoglycoside phosphotransferase (APT) family kinase protein
MSITSRPGGTPPAEHVIDAHLVRRLLAEQHPDLASLPLRGVDGGWDNALFRLGDRLAVRLPRRTVAADLIVHEHRWLPHLAGQLTLPIPVPARVGAPGCGYPWPWSVQRWLPGDAADEHPPAPGQALPFAAFLRALHTPAPADAPRNPVRGDALSARAPVTELRLQRLAERTGLITARVRDVWRRALAAPIDVPPTWLHGDLHPRNVLVARGAISGVIDWGDLTAGDRATDLAAIWMHFADAHARQVALAAYGDLSPATLARARGWAIHLGAVLLETGLVDTPRHARIGARTLRRIDAGE